jgi:signal transduction histidine kinase
VGATNEAGDVTLVRGITLNITPIEEAREAAEAANRAKTKFLSSMSHELRTPLNSILGYGQLLHMGNKLDAHDTEHLNAILSGGRHLLNLVNDLLQITREGVEQAAFHLVALNLSELCQRCCVMLSPVAQDSGIAINNLVFDRHMVVADALRLQQVVINVLANAIKYSEKNTTVTLQVAKLPQDMWRLTVVDQGPGIAPHVGQQVFEPFYRVPEQERRHEGAGIGLSVSWRLVERMNGRMSYDSTEGVGSSFHIDLPAATPTNTKTGTNTDTPTSPTSPTGPAA